MCPAISASQTCHGRHLDTSLLFHHSPFGALSVENMQQLPSDLSDLVIDHLATETAALKACGLVCKQWFPRSRFHLFSELNLQVGSALKNKGFVDVDTMDEFMDVMDFSPSNILTTVRHLQLSYGDEKSIPKAHLLQFPSCPQLLYLSIGLPRNSSEDVIEAIREQLAVVGGKFPSLSSLVFRFHHSSIRAAALFDVVACFPTLENLSLGGDDVVTDGTRSLGLFPARLNTIDMHILRVTEAASKSAVPAHRVTLVIYTVTNIKESSHGTVTSALQADVHGGLVRQNWFTIHHRVTILLKHILVGKGDSGTGVDAKEPSTEPRGVDGTEPSTEPR
ncbi:hypothetical protein B0H11DRAFT_2197455 [Mycena galericulata]|nr:hypothetical protein B0H11DRAFT_2197455 [Mycena galericulata]